MARFKNLLDGMSIMAKYIEDDESSEIEVESYEAHSTISVGKTDLKMCDVDLEKLIGLGWELDEEGYWLLF